LQLAPYVLVAVRIPLQGKGKDLKKRKGGTEFRAHKRILRYDAPPNAGKGRKKLLGKRGNRRIKKKTIAEDAPEEIVSKDLR